MKPYNVYYSGGCGGNVFFWSLQLALGNDVADQIDKQWDISEYSKWREFEQVSLSSPWNGNSHRLNNVELFCNAGIDLPTDAITLVAYTDTETQIALAELKAANWFRIDGDCPDPVADFEKRKETTALIRKYSIEHNGILVYHLSKELIDAADYSFLLQDVIKTKFKCVTDALGLIHTQEIADHIDKWVALHPENIQELFYKDI